MAVSGQGRRSAFAGVHPAVRFGFFACALGLGMCLRHPVFQAIGLAGALALCLLLRGRRALRLVGGLALVAVLVAAVNPLFDPLGNTVVLTWADGRPYTLEALGAGLSAGVMLADVLLLFSCYNAVMDAEAVQFLFGRIAPAASFVLSATLRLVPDYRRAVRAIATADRCTGGGVRAAQAGRRARLARSGMHLSALAGWALESGVVAADSLRARGFGLPGRTSFSLYRFGMRDGVLVGGMLVLAAGALAAVASGAADVAYLPALRLPVPTLAGAVGCGCYAALLALPCAMEIREAVSWRCSLSRI